MWLEPVQSMPRRKTHDSWTDEHCNVMRKLVVEGGLVQQRFYDICWTDEKKRRGRNNQEGTEKHRLYHCPSWRKIRRPTRRRKIGNRVAPCKVEAIGGETIVSVSGCLKGTTPGACQLKHFEATSPPMVLLVECWEDGVRVGGQWCGLIMMRRWSRCMGCMVL